MFAVHSVGYAHTSLTELDTFVATHGVVVVDVRHRPTSRQPAYRRAALQAHFGDRYRHVPALGNVNYQGGPIRIADLEAGLAEVRALLATGPVALLCVCADAARCHRTLIADRLAAEGYPVGRLPLFDGL